MAVGNKPRVSPTENQEGKTPSPSISRQSSIETDRATRDFVDFLKSLPKPGREVHKQSRAFIDIMASKKVRRLSGRRRRSSASADAIDSIST